MFKKEKKNLILTGSQAKQRWLGRPRNDTSFAFKISRNYDNYKGCIRKGEKKEGKRKKGKYRKHKKHVRTTYQQIEKNRKNEKPLEKNKKVIYEEEIKQQKQGRKQKLCSTRERE